MKVLIIGSGGREHSLAWVCDRSELSPEIICVPGNGGTEGIARNIALDIDSADELVSLALEEDVDLVLIGPEAPLVSGLADSLRRAGVSVFGPGKDAAMIEGSKSFAKQLMVESGIPTAAYRMFNCNSTASSYIRDQGAPLVVKASGLAAGKGVFVCETIEDALANTEAMLLRDAFGAAGREIVIEECLIGREMSLMALVDGEDFLLLPPSRDHKRAYDNDTGPNTGGMGAYGPLSDVSDSDIREAALAVFPPIVKRLNQLEGGFRGCLYAGLIATDEGIKVLEFNCRFGDPEAQIVFPLLGFDLLELMMVVAEGTLSTWIKDHDVDPLDWRSLTTGRHAATIIAAVSGYPDSYNKGMVIASLPDDDDNHIVFHAGTKLSEGILTTSGGRVIAITGLGESHSESVANAYKWIEQVRFDGVRYRSDIGRTI